MDEIEFASDVGGVAIEDWSVTIMNFTWVTKDNNLSVERLNFEGSVNFGVRSDITSPELFDSDVFDIETNVITWDSLDKVLMMHFNRFDFRNQVGWGELNELLGFKDTSLDSSYWDCSDTRDFVDILERESQGFIEGSLRGLQLVKSFIEGLPLEPFHVVRFLDHVVTFPAGDGDELNFLDLVTDFFEIGFDFGLDLLESLLRVVDGLLIHLVDTNDHLLNTEGKGKKGVFSGLSIFGDTSFELSFRGGDHQNGAISLRGTGDHVLDEISVAGSVDDGEVVFFGLEFPEGDIDGDSSFSFGLKFIENPGVFE